MNFKNDFRDFNFKISLYTKNFFRLLKDNILKEILILFLENEKKYNFNTILDFFSPHNLIFFG